MRREAIGACAVIVALGLGFAGCGDDDDSSGEATTESITQEEFVAQANEICAEGNEELDAASEETFSGGQPSRAEIESFFSETVLPNVEEQVTAIAELPVPEGDEEQVNAILDSVNQGLDEVESDPEAAAGNGDPFAEANRLANEYGLTECGS